MNPDVTSNRMPLDVIVPHTKEIKKIDSASIFIRVVCN
jgi:hypothetical protein